MTAHDAIREIRTVIEAIPDTPDHLRPMEAARHIAEKYMAAITEIEAIAGVAEPAPVDSTQGALFDLPKPTPPSAIAEGR